MTGVQGRASKIWQLLFLLSLAALFFSSELSAKTRLDRSLKPEQDDEKVSPIFTEMGVVQRKAKEKGGHFLLSSYLTLDFSDGPLTMYSLNVNPGFAISDFWEIYFNFVPYFLTSQRPIAKKIASLTLANGKSAKIEAAIPKLQYGAELVYAFGYGKDSFGFQTIIRSDTFIKVGVAQIKYDTDSGLKLHGSIGKSYFIGDTFGLRVSIGGNYVQSILDSEKSFNLVAVIESGVMIYL